MEAGLTMEVATEVLQVVVGVLMEQARTEGEMQAVGMVMEVMAMEVVEVEERQRVMPLPFKLALLSRSKS